MCPPHPQRFVELEGLSRAFQREAVERHQRLTTAEDALATAKKTETQLRAYVSRLDEAQSKLSQALAQEMKKREDAEKQVQETKAQLDVVNQALTETIAKYQMAVEELNAHEKPKKIDSKKTKLLK